MVRTRTPVHVPACGEPMLAHHNVIKHAAHGAGAHDLARWSVVAACEPTGDQLTAIGVAAAAELHCDYFTDGRRYWIYVQRLPLSPEPCAQCGAATSAALFARRGLS